MLSFCGCRAGRDAETPDTERRPLWRHGCGAWMSMGAKPKYVICDKGVQFWCDAFKAWCKRHGIRPRFGAVGKHGSIAVIERFIRSLKQEGLRRTLISLCQRTFCQEVPSYSAWYNEYRPHVAARLVPRHRPRFSRRPSSRRYLAGAAVGPPRGTIRQAGSASIPRKPPVVSSTNFRASAALGNPASTPQVKARQAE
jgi:hypothetical protein